MPRQVFVPYPETKPNGYSQVVRAGNLVFVSGQVGLDPQGNLVGPGDCKAQAEQCFRNIESALDAAGATMDDVTKITCFLTDFDDYAKYAAVRRVVFPEDGPASSSVVVEALADRAWLVELEAIAVVA